jgi:predicted HTH domain antitoxin
MSQILIPLANDVADLLGDTPEHIERHVHEVLVLDLYRRHAISAGRAAELLEMEKLDFIRWSGALGIPYIDLTKDELEEELRILGTL